MTDLREGVYWLCQANSEEELNEASAHACVLRRLFFPVIGVVSFPFNHPPKTVSQKSTRPFEQRPRQPIRPFWSLIAMGSMVRSTPE